MDPGTTIGIVSIDEDGNIDFHFSGKNISTEKIVETIKNIEGVVLISTDKHKIPKKIIEIASKLNLGIYYPKKDIPLDKKKKFYTNEKLKEILKDNHEIDAYISAYFALTENKDLFRKAKKISNDYKEYIEILRKSFKNRKLEPFAALETIKESEKEELDTKKKRIRKKRIYEKSKPEDFSIYLKEEKKDEKNNINLLNKYLKKYISLIKDYNTLSKILVNKIEKNSDIIPKISFLIKNNLRSPIVFVDIINSDVLSYISKYNSKIYITEDKIKDLTGFRQEVFLVRDYEDIKNFIILKNFEKIDLKPHNDIDIEKIKKLIDSLR
ncbi:MAG: DUF460 domain-containing protein [Nanopusillaceae archaeon]